MPADNPASNPSADPSGQDEKARARARLGKTVNGKYRLDSMLGMGGMATVYGATHRNGSRVALKLLHSEFGRDAGIRERFLREGYVANRVDHPGRVAILDDDVTEQDEPFLVMELLEGETLQQLWKRMGRKLPVPEALRIAEASLDTLHAFHEVGIVHRDIKPANIFITKDKVVKLLDFGVARMRDAGGDKTRAGTALGTPSFMAPEQAMGLTDGVDGRADVFSIGATLYAVLSGQRLHQGRSDNEAFILAATQPAPSLARVAPNLPVEIIALVDKALAWDPRNRFESAEAMRDECRLHLEAFRPATSPGAPEGAFSPEPTGGAATAPRARGTTVDPLRALQAPTAISAPPILSGPSAAEAPVVPPAAADDPAVLRLVDVFRRIERLLPAVRQYGWQHPEPESKLRALHQSVNESLAENASAVTWTLLPYSFLHRGQTVWEPVAPFDVIPYNFFAAGIRGFRITLGVTEAELRALCEVFLLDPFRDLSPEDDVGGALWERQLEHIETEVINVFAEGDAADREAFFEEADQLETVASRASDERINRVEAAAMNIQVEAQNLEVRRSAVAVLQIDSVAKRTVAAQLETSTERWSERFVQVLAEATLDTVRRRDTSLVAAPLDQSARSLILARRFDVVFSMYDATRRAVVAVAGARRIPGVDPAALGPFISRSMFGVETFRLLLVESIRSNQQAVVQGIGANAASAAVDLDWLAQRLSVLLPDLGSEYVDAVVVVLDSVKHERLRQTLMTFLERSALGREAQIVERIPTMSIDAARAMMRILSGLRTRESDAALRQIAASNHPTLKCEATAFLAQNPDQIREDLGRLLEATQPELRQAALRAMAFHQVRAAGPILVRKVSEPSFNLLSKEERRELLVALYALNPKRGEELAIEIVQKHGLLVDEALEQTRALCAELLGQHALQRGALEAVLAAAKRRWWNTQPLREAALASAELIAARIGVRISPAGEIVG